MHGPDQAPTLGSKSRNRVVARDVVALRCRQRGPHEAYTRRHIGELGCGTTSDTTVRHLTGIESLQRYTSDVPQLGSRPVGQMLRTEVNMPLESKPAKIAPVPSWGTPYRVRDGDDWLSVARKFRVNVQSLIKHNFNTLNTNEVNWYLRTRVGCVAPSLKGWNWRFSSRANPGIIYIPETPGLFEIQMQTYTYAIATLSWIDPRTGLPEVDEGGDPGDAIVRTSIMANKGYRFANFLEATVNLVNIGTGPRAMGHVGYTSDCGIYRAPSFLDFPSYAYPIKLFEPTYTDEGIEFRQIVGARTQSAELAASKLGPIPAGPIAQYLFPFPPIWSDLKLIIRYDGTYTGELSAYSLFPSLTYYENSSIPCFVKGGSLPCQAFEKKFGYDGMPNYKRWMTEGKGWGMQRGSSPGEGNPWGVTKPDTGAIYGEAQPDPNEVVRRPTKYPAQEWLPPRK